MKRLLLLTPSLFLLTASGAELGRPDLGSPEFVKRFTASYGVLSAREPQVTEIEEALLQKLAPLVGSSPAQAQAMLESMLSDGKPVSAAFNHVLGNLYFTARQWNKAEIEYRAAIDKFPDFQRAWNSLGSLRMQRENYRGAAEALARAVELGASDSQSYGMLGYSLLQNGEFVAAEIAYNMALLRSPGNVRWLEGKARILAESGRHAEAVTALEELLRKHPGNVEYWRLMANAHLGLEQLTESARDLEIARQLGPLDASALYLLGNIHMRRGMTDHALDAYLAAVKLEPKSTPTTLLSFARTLLGKDQYDLARQLLAVLDPTDTTWNPRLRMHYEMLLGRIALHDGDKNAALAGFQRALELEPLNAECLYRISELYAGLGQKDKARYHLERITDDTTYEYGAQMFLARMLIEDQRMNEALVCLRKAIRLNPSAEAERLYNVVRVAAQTRG